MKNLIFPHIHMKSIEHHNSEILEIYILLSLHFLAGPFLAFFFFFLQAGNDSNEISFSYF